MRKVRTAALAGVVVLAAAGAAMAAGHDTHYLNVAMPDGAVARIEYHGDVAPLVTVAPARPPSLPVALFDPFDAAPFALFDRIGALMDRQTDRMLQAAALGPQPAAGDGKPDLAAFGRLPVGTVHYSFVSTSTGSGICSRSVQVTSLGAGRAPKVVSNSSGDCVGRPHGGTPTAQQPASAAQPAAAATAT